MMKSFSCLWILLLGMSLTSHAQQILCEREMRVSQPAYFRADALLRLQPDSLRLLTDYYSNTSTPSPLQVRLQRLSLNNCDTLPAEPKELQANHTEGAASIAATNRRGQVLVAQYLRRYLAAGTFDSTRIALWLINRDGTTRWQRIISPQSTAEGVSGIIEAPENGFFLFGGEYHLAVPGPGRTYDIVLRLDSTGRELWRRRYPRVANAALENPVYTRAGTLLGTADYTAPGVPTIVTLMEFNQRGDSLATRRLTITPQQYTRLPFLGTNALCPIRGGNFALVGQVDSANTGYTQPFLAQLDSQGNLIWSYVFHTPPTAGYRFDQPQELADGSLLVLASTQRSGRNEPFWLLRFSSSGQLINRYPFASQVLPPYNSTGRYGYFGRAMGLQPFSDSTLVVAASHADLSSSRIYLAHLRVPGLPRVIDSHYLPAADPLATLPATATKLDWELWPNPATEVLHLRYPQANRAAKTQLVLRDLLGRSVLTHPLNPTSSEATISLQALPPGLYQAALISNGQVLATRKLAVAR
jgi:hypothetical protein